ncbi:MAG: iron chelate uptake ABC transporter family permease subunit [Alphaproteobacteria bacterium]|nr:iron chelate uptake ABC transporter family permease subunit [Alphaproteobacteria bacterium]
MSALIAPLVLAVIAGPVGCLIVWRRMAYFGDAIAHSALLGVALGLFIGFAPNIGVALICAIFAVLLVYLQHRRKLSIDTLLGILAHGALALGLLLVFWSALETGHNPHNGSNHSIDPHTLLEIYLLGSLENISMNQNIILIVGASLIAITLKLIWEPLILMTLNIDLARAEGVPTLRLQYIMMGIMTALVVMGLQITGVLFITSLLIMPAAAARQISTTPEKMILWAIIFAFSGVLTGYMASHEARLPPGPSIVSALTVIFIISLFISVFLRRKNPRI